MKRIFKNETLKTILNPTTIGFFIIPIILFAIIVLSVGDGPVPYALATTTFLQIIIIAFFGYGFKVKVYQNETLEKKIVNSKFSKYQYIVPFLIIYILILIITLMPIYLISIVLTDSLGYLERNQYDLILLATNDELGEFSTGLNKNYLLFNSNFETFAQFIYSFAFSTALSFSFAHCITLFSKNENRLLTYSLIIFIFIIMLSGLMSKVIYVLQEEQYVRSPKIISNKVFNLIKYCNPFYWANQLLTATIVADANSGDFIDSDLPQAAIDAGAGRHFNFAYYNIFEIGINYPDVIDFSTLNGRQLILDNIEAVQLMIVSYCPVAATAIIASCLIIEVRI